MNNAELIDSIKSFGYKPKVYHYRLISAGDKEVILGMEEIKMHRYQNRLVPFGGETHVSLLKEDMPYERHYFLALCSSKDKYCRFTGANTALERAYNWCVSQKKLEKNG